MEEQQKQAKRTRQDVQREYAGLCAKLGDIEMKLDNLNNDSKLVKEQLHNLNFEHIALVKAEEEEAAKQVASEEKKDA